jgi:hypothetical protein
MNQQFLYACGLFLVLTGTVLPSAHAEITKCKDADGQITYSDSSCGDATVIARFSEVASTSADVELPSKVIMQPSIERRVTHESAWARPIALPAHKSTDLATLAEARQTLRAMDRALAAMRSHTMVSSR